VPPQTERYVASRSIESGLKGQQAVPHVAGKCSESEDLIDFGGSKTEQAEIEHSDATSAGPVDAPLAISPRNLNISSPLLAEAEATGQHSDF
jgi:hypothetical protein